MIVPSIDILDGQAVQLVEGEEPAIEAGNPQALMERFARVGEVAVIDIEAARGTGSNRPQIERLLSMGDVRVGGGIRDLETALSWLDAGAAKVIIGTAATPELLRALPKERVIVAADSRDGTVVSHGWRQDTGEDLLSSIERLRDLCSGFLVTFVEREGRLAGTDMQRAQEVIDAAGPARVTIAGGVTTTDEIAVLHAMGADAQVGMALYDGRMSLADAIGAVLSSDRDDGLWPTVVVDEHGTALGLAWSSASSLALSIESGEGVYQSRKRGLWTKGATSGATQKLLRIDVDCDSDALRFMVQQKDPGFCHQNSRTCWGDDKGLPRLSRTIGSIQRTPPAESNTRRLLEDQELLADKLREEVTELIAASTAEDVAEEAADVLYFSMVKAASAGVQLADVEQVLDARARRVTRRPMRTKESE